MMFGLFKKKRTDDGRILECFKIVDDNPEHQARFYAHLAKAIRAFKEQINCSHMSYEEILFALTPDQCRKIAGKQREVQNHLEKQDDDALLLAGFIGMIAISLEGKAGNADASPDTIDFLNKMLVKVDDAAQSASSSEAPSQDQPSADTLDLVEVHLQAMGYDLTSYGATVALLEVASGYNEVETASHIALTTMALDVREAGDDIVRLVGFVPHGRALLDVLEEYKDKGAMRTSQWQNDANALLRIITVNEHQEEWIDKILSDPVAGKERLANSNINSNADYTETSN